MTATSCLETPVGWLEVTASHRGVVAVRFVDARTSPTRYCQPSPATELLGETRRQLREYFEGTRKEFTVPCAQQGTDFEQRVWRALLDIPFATTATYGQVGEAVGRPGGAQAVGQAVGANPLGIIVPCHRVVAANGIGGYGWGIERKRWLLEHEARVAAGRTTQREERSNRAVTVGASS